MSRPSCWPEAHVVPTRSYVRWLSPLERYSLVLHEAYRYHVDGIIEGVGTVDRDALQRAVDCAADANRAIRVRLRGCLRFMRWVDSGIAPVVRLLPLSDWDGSSERSAPFLLEKLQPLKGGAVADVLIVPCRDGKTRLVFRTVHAAIDGRGFMHWLAEVFRALRGEALLGSDSRLTEPEVKAQHADKVVAEPKAPPVAFIPVIAPSENGRDPLAYVWRRLLLDARLPQLLPGTAVFLAEWARRHQSGEVAFTIPIDYRGLRTDEMGLGNLTGYLQLSVEEGASPRSVMRQLNQKLQRYADCRRVPGGSLVYWLPLRYLLRRLLAGVDKLLYTSSPALPAGGIVSMGLLKLATYSAPGFDAHVAYGIPGAVGKLNIVIGNYADFTAVTFTAPAAYNSEGQLDALIAAYRARFSAKEQAS